MSEDVRLGVEPGVEPGVEAEEFRPSEWESAFLSIALFGGLILFGVGCVLFGWS